jgi:diguanylate cyclase (GGDEF)-like protein
VPGKKSVLFAGDDQFLRDWYLKTLNEGGYLAGGTTLADLETTLTRFIPDLVLIDLPRKEDSQKYIAQVLRLRPAIPVVLLAEFEDFSFAGRAFRSGADEVLPKPVEPQLMLMILHRVIEEDRLLKENKELRDYMKLYSSCQRITTQLEAEGVLTATVTALLAETGSRAAFYLDWSSLTTTPRMEGLLGLEESESKIFLNELLPSIRQSAGKDDASTIVFEHLDGDFNNLLEHDFVEALIIPLRNLESLLGVFILLRHKQDHPWPAKVMAEVNFIGRHAALAWHNATLYADAKEMAFQDALTGLYNARYLPIAIDREIAHSKESGAPFAVLFLDLDYFKRVNDIHGHQIGSQLLKEVGRVLRRCIRDDDIVVRYGGDEFTVLLKATNLPTAEQIAERIRTMLAGHPFLGREGLSVLITACIGVSVYPVHARSAEELIFLADHAMYKGKNATRNMVITADPKDLIGQTLPQP